MPLHCKGTRLVNKVYIFEDLCREVVIETIYKAYKCSKTDSGSFLGFYPSPSRRSWSSSSSKNSFASPQRWAMYLLDSGEELHDLLGVYVPGRHSEHCQSRGCSHLRGHVHVTGGQGYQQRKILLLEWPNWRASRKVGL